MSHAKDNNNLNVCGPVKPVSRRRTLPSIIRWTKSLQASSSHLESCLKEITSLFREMRAKVEGIAFLLDQRRVYIVKHVLSDGLTKLLLSFFLTKYQFLILGVRKIVLGIMFGFRLSGQHIMLQWANTERVNRYVYE